jgi:hypothetical protein
MIVIALIVTVCSANRASRRSISPPPRIATAVNSGGATQLPLRTNPPRMATAEVPAGCPPNLFSPPNVLAPPATPIRSSPEEGRSAVTGASSAYVFAA